MNTLEILNVKKSFKQQVILDDFSLTCATGDIIGIFGRNGAGKSTLLKLIFGILKADAIDIRINTKYFNQKSIIPSKKIGYLPQHTFLPPEKKVRDIIAMFFADGKKQDKIFYAPKVSSFETVKAGALSQGQLRYLEILIIGNLDHPFILLDEPFSMIEPIYKSFIKAFLTELKHKKGIILTDHYYQDVLEITEKNFIIKNAKKFEIKSKDDLVEHNYLKSTD